MENAHGKPRSPPGVRMDEPRIYLDHAASAPPLPGVAGEVSEVLGATGNPSSAHAEGREARAHLENARSRASSSLGCRAREIVFTGSGTLAAWIALVGAARARRAIGRRIVLSAVEHPCVGDAARSLESEGFEVVYVPPESDGHVDADSFLAHVENDTAVAALMLANHESGACMPVRAVAAGTRARRVPLLCDACLGADRVPARPEDLDADLVAYSAHKLGGLPGSGLLYVRRRTQVAPLFGGGLQEERLHAGTEGIVGAVALAVALEHALRDVSDRAARYDDLVSSFLEELLPAKPWTRITPQGGLPGLLTLELPGVEGEAAMINLDLEGISVSTGSRCALGATEASPSLIAMGLSPKRAACTIRVSVGESNDDTDVKRAARVLVTVVERLRAAARR